MLPEIFTFREHFRSLVFLKQILNLTTKSTVYMSAAYLLSFLEYIYTMQHTGTQHK